MPTRSHVFPQKLSKYEILQKLQIANERRNMNVGFPPFLMRLCVAKGRAGLKPGGHYQREDDEAEFESTWGCMRRSRGAWEHWKHFTSLVEPQWHSTARGVWKHSGHVGPELGLMIILPKEKHKLGKKMSKLLIGAKNRPQLLRIKSEKRGFLALKRDEQTSRTWASFFERKVQYVISKYAKYSSILVFKCSKECAMRNWQVF